MIINKLTEVLVDMYPAFTVDSISEFITDNTFVNLVVEDDDSFQQMICKLEESKLNTYFLQNAFDDMWSRCIFDVSWDQVVDLLEDGV